MSVIQQSAIKEIVRELDIGNTCYIEKSTAKIIIIDNSIEDIELLAAQEQTKVAIELKLDKYVKLEKLSEQVQLVIMKDFLEELSNKSVRKELSNALKRKNPVRNFNRQIESDMALNLHWTNFNSEESRRWISSILIDAYNY